MAQCILTPMRLCVIWSLLSFGMPQPTIDYGRCEDHGEVYEAGDGKEGRCYLQGLLLRTERSLLVHQREIINAEMDAASARTKEDHALISDTLEDVKSAIYIQNQTLAEVKAATEAANDALKSQARTLAGHEETLEMVKAVSDAAKETAEELKRTMIQSLREVTVAVDELKVAINKIGGNTSCLETGSWSLNNLERYKEIQNAVPLAESVIATFEMTSSDKTCQEHCGDNAACDAVTIQSSTCRLYTRGGADGVYLRHSDGVNYYTKTSNGSAPVKLYTLVTERLTFDAALARCPELVDNSHLVDIQTAEENKAVWSFKPFVGLSGLCGDNVLLWTSGKCLDAGWKWATTGQSISFTAWIPGQPDYHQGLEDSLNLNIHGTNGEHSYWNDLSPTYRLCFICEMSIS